ncbi:hypothetical protein [Pelagibius sp. Alg239-R121]|uniref:hypothetical protein n=1 Tax=Pelagibius sp. Alg239-R121 TaxID=2993448 RepID=UPI0024A72064|nr:hypothetical protein [Pelagibius sp. Alg239-R121]
MLRAQTTTNAVRCRGQHLSAASFTLFSRVMLVLFLGLNALVASQLAVAQDPAAFVTGMEDVPLMPQLQDVPDAAVIFDKPSGRLVEAYAEGDVEGAEVLGFYRETLPQLGWTSESETGASGVFFRESERLEIHILEGQTRHTVRFVLSPK